MATSEGIPSSIDIEFLELNDNPYIKNIWRKSCVGILGETEGGKARFEGFGGELGTGGKAVSEGWRAWL